MQNVLSEAWVVPVSDLGTSDKQLHCRTHLGHLLTDGDMAWGFDFTRANVNDTNLDKMKQENLPDVVRMLNLFSLNCMSLLIITHTHTYTHTLTHAHTHTHTQPYKEVQQR